MGRSQTWAIAGARDLGSWECAGKCTPFSGSRRDAELPTTLETGGGKNAAEEVPGGRERVEAGAGEEAGEEGVLLHAHEAGGRRGRETAPAAPIRRQE